MKKVRIKFTKKDRMKYVGHLDLLKLFQRAVKRAEIPVSYSKGFNPHQIMSFAIPLSVGVESTGEYVDIQLDNDMENEEIKGRLKKALPIGMEVVEIRDFRENEKNAAAVIEAALYEIRFDRKIDNIGKILEGERLITERTSKGKTKETDIKPDIFSIEEKEENEKTILMAMIAAGSRRNLKPSLLAEYIYRASGEKFRAYRIKYKRIEMYRAEEGRFIPLGE